MKVRNSVAHLGLVLALGVSATALAASDDAPAPYRAKLVNDQIITSNGKYTYVVDPSALHETLSSAGSVELKIYGTEIWLTLDKAGIATVQKTRRPNMAYYVLAPLKDMESAKDRSIDYKKFAIGYANSNSLTFPAAFCSSCAAPTTVDEKTSDTIREIFSQANSGELTMASHKPGSS